MAETSVILNVTDIEKSIAFYEGLGFDTAARHSHEGTETAFASLDLDGAVLELAASQLNEDPDFQDWVSGPLGGGVMVNIDVQEPDAVDAIHQRAVDVGAVVESEPDDLPFGRAFTLNDPDGYVVTFLAEDPRSD